ncbi:MAG: lysophospholipid acyltransferase family protein [Candidatus Eisenbacteria bacterium]
MRKSLRRFCAYLLIRVLVSLARVLPRRLGSAVFGNLGAVAYLCLRKSRRIALVNLRLIYGRAAPDKEIRRIARRAFINLGKFAYDVVNLNRVAPQGLARIIEVTGLDNLDRALDRGKGVILLSGHVGNWELMAAYLSRAGYPLNVLATRLKDSRLDQLIAGLRRNVGIAVLERSGGLKAALRCLNRGEILGILIDQDTSVESVLVDFLGRPTKTAVGPVKLASRTGAAIVPLAMLMTDNGHYRIEVKEPLVVSGQEASLVNDVERCSKAVETFIRAEPSQWVWMHRRWKSVVSDLYS